MKSKNTLAKRKKAERNGRHAGSKPAGPKKEKKTQRKEPTANELMFEAWKKLYQTRQDRLL